MKNFRLDKSNPPKPLAIFIALLVVGVVMIVVISSSNTRSSKRNVALDAEVSSWLISVNLIITNAEAEAKQLYEMVEGCNAKYTNQELVEFTNQVKANNYIGKLKDKTAILTSRLKDWRPITTTTRKQAYNRMVDRIKNLDRLNEKTLNQASYCLEVEDKFFKALKDL